VIGIKSIASYVPEGRLDNRERMAEFDIEEDFLTQKIGVDRVARRAEGEDTGDLCVRAFENLAARSGIDTSNVDCLIVCTQNPHANGLPHTSAVLHGRLGLDRACACFDISLGCSGFVHSLGVATAFMDANGLSNGLLFTADPYSKIVNPHDRNTALIFGDGATVSWLANGDADVPLLSPVAAQYHTEGDRGAALQNRGGVLHMDGRAVFNFSATVVPAQVKALLADRGLELGDIDLFLFHQGSRFIVEAIRKRLRLDAERAPLKMADFGNLVSSSIPIMLESVVDGQQVQRVVASGFGVGLASATCLLERCPAMVEN